MTTLDPDGDDPAFSFGYPRACERCMNLKPSCSLRVAPFLQVRTDFRVMLVGQDPTIFDNPDRVRRALMLDQSGGQLSRWLKDLLGDCFNSATVYATNVVKCTFDEPPSRSGVELDPYFSHCRTYLKREVEQFEPTVAISFGEPAHKLFVSLCDGGSRRPPFSMKSAFTGRMHRVSIAGRQFDYTPCLHIKTFRVAETYGDAAKSFRAAMRKRFTGEPAEGHSGVKPDPE